MLTFMLAAAPLLAHQGGWDEILLIAVPIVAIVVALGIAKRRVDAAAQPASSLTDSEADNSAT